MRGAAGWTDHRLVRSQLTLTVQKPFLQKRNKSVLRLNIASLKQEETREQLEEANELDQLEPDFNDVGKDRSKLRDITRNTAEKSLAMRRKRIRTGSMMLILNLNHCQSVLKSVHHAHEDCEKDSYSKTTI